MGILEDIKESLDSLHAKIDALSVGGGASSGGGRGRKAADKPDFTAEQLRDKFIEVQKKHGDVDAKALIAELGYDKLAKLVADTKNWQKCWDAAEAKLAEEPTDDDGGL